MADNVTIPATGSGTATPVVATDDVAGVHFQKVKLDIGGDGASSPVTSLALETGGNLDAAVAALQIIDDWDETDRAKVNIIAGQAGIAAGAGAVGATVPRVTLASDDPAVTALQIMDDWDNAASDGASVSGDTAHDSPDAGEPVKVGGKAATALPTAVAANDRTNLLTDVYGRPFVRTGSQGPAGGVWTQLHVPAANTQATKSQSAGAAGVRNVCTGFTVTLAAGTTAPSAAQVTVALIDGASGGGTYLWRSNMSLPAVAGAQTTIVRTGLWLPGTAATAMTLEFSAAGGANTYETVSMEGTTVAE
ncbi:MAG: hypothetical protein OEW98_00245 [Betaproteobacteria bacterium]|nr:hypothetical protein [Betaproteobacteria bacterium]